MQSVGVGDGVLGIPSGREAEVDDDLAAEPVGVGAGAEGVDGAGDLAAGDGGQLGEGGGGALEALAEGGVEEVDSGGGDGDADLAGGGYGGFGALVDEVLGGAEGVEADGAHGLQGVHTDRLRPEARLRSRLCRLPLSVARGTMGTWRARGSRGSRRR